VETIKRQTWAACGCLAARSKVPCARRLAYRLHACSVCDVQRRCSCSMRLVTLYKCYAFTFYQAYQRQFVCNRTEIIFCKQSLITRPVLTKFSQRVLGVDFFNHSVDQMSASVCSSGPHNATKTATETVHYLRTHNRYTLHMG